MIRLGAALVLTLAAATNAGAFAFTDCNGVACDWASLPVSYSIWEPLGVDGDEEALLAEIRASFDRWAHDRQTFCKPLGFTYNGRIGTGQRAANDGRNIVFFETDYWPYGAQALAVTSCWYDQSGTFVDCDIAINAVNFAWTVDGAGGSFSLRETLTHEVGHFWGLDHSANSAATMYTYYKPQIAADDLDEDDIRAAAQRFCDGMPPADDAEEQNDSAQLARVLDNRFELTDLRLYDDDWWQFTLAAGMRVKATVADDHPERFKRLELYDADGHRLGAERCDGDCAQALGEAGDERIVSLRVTGEFDEHAVQPERYHLTIEQVAPGDEGELTDDDETTGDDDDDDDGCGCAVGGDRGDAAVAGLLLTLTAAFLLLRKKATR
ncbi:MAG TPA: matrixin family metalloprotease [bacterium]|nr:matrixin family metalloprotease [bacterium]